MFVNKTKGTSPPAATILGRFCGTSAKFAKARAAGRITWVDFECKAPINAGIAPSTEDPIWYDT